MTTPASLVALTLSALIMSPPAVHADRIPDPQRPGWNDPPPPMPSPPEIAAVLAIGAVGAIGAARAFRRRPSGPSAL